MTSLILSFFILGFVLFTISVYWKFWYSKQFLREQLITKSFSWTKKAIIASSLLVVLSVSFIAFGLPKEFILLILANALAVFFAFYFALQSYVSVMKEFGFMQKKQKFNPLAFFIALIGIGLITFLASKYLNLSFELNSLFDYLTLMLFGLYSILTLILLYWSNTIRDTVSEDLIVNGYNKMLYAFTVFSFIAQLSVIYLLTFSPEVFGLIVLALVTFLYLLWDASSHFCCSDKSFVKVYSVKPSRRPPRG